MQPRKGISGKRRRTRMFGWWYVCLGVGFVLLGFRSLLRGDALWSIILRYVIAAGFVILGVATLRSSPPANSSGPKP
jgi:hypothetical protein